MPLFKPVIICHSLPTLYSGMGFCFLDEDVGLIGTDDSDAPGDAFVVADSDTGQSGFSGADDVPARCIQMHEIP